MELEKNSNSVVHRGFFEYSFFKVNTLLKNDIIAYESTQKKYDDFNDRSELSFDDRKISLLIHLELLQKQ